MFSVTILSRDPEAEVETTVAGVRFDLGPGVGREGLSLRDPAAGLVDYSHWLTALRYLTVTFEDDETKSWEKTLSGIYFLMGTRSRINTLTLPLLPPRIEYVCFPVKTARPKIHTK